VRELRPAELPPRAIATILAALARLSDVRPPPLPATATAPQLPARVSAAPRPRASPPSLPRAPRRAAPPHRARALSHRARAPPLVLSGHAASLTPY
jgi:hypothetical protein